MPSIPELVPDPQTLLALGQPELGRVILAHFQAMPIHEQQQRMTRTHLADRGALQGYPMEMWERVQQALMEGWGWLEREGLIAQRAEEPGWYLITRAGQQLQTAADVAAYRESTRFPPALLHPRIKERTWADFLRGEYDTAVFKAFREVEVAVRTASGLPQASIGVQLMRQAFGDHGPLTDQQAAQGEQDARRELFSGAIGSFKNPHSHRNVPLADPAEAFETLMLASHLMRIVDARAGRTSTTPGPTI